MEQKSKYQNGKIYAIRSPHSDMFYIGSTCNLLSKRFNQHKCVTKNQATSNIIFDFNDAYIELLENYPCKDRNELNKREGELIRLHKDLCVNIQVPFRTDKEYYEQNKNKIKETQKGYYEKNKEKINEYKKNWLREKRKKKNT